MLYNQSALQPKCLTTKVPYNKEQAIPLCVYIHVCKLGLARIVCVYTLYMTVYW